MSYRDELKAEAERLRRLGLSKQAIANLLPSGDTCEECGEKLVEPAELCGFCIEMAYGGEPMPPIEVAA